MINKFYKTINIKYSNFLKSFFFLRYVLTIFLICIASFLLIPKLFDYEKKREIISEYLVKNYDLELINYNSIKFKVFPFPNLSINNTELIIQDSPNKLKSNHLRIFLKLESIYDNKKIKANKIILNDSQIISDINKAKELLGYCNYLENKFTLKNLQLILKKDEKSLLKIHNIHFSNYGFKKNVINGEMFDKKFIISLKNNQNLNFKFLDTGIEANIKFNEKNFKTPSAGTSKINILNNIIKFDFVLKDDQIEITRSNLRNKDLSISFDNTVIFKPFFKINSYIKLDKINKKIFEKIDLEKILQKKEIIRKLNGKNTISYKAKKFRNNFVLSYYSQSSLANGRLNFSNATLISGGSINCIGDSLLTEEYPRLNFDCKIQIKDKKKFFSKVFKSQKMNNDSFNLNVKGSLNLLKKKINFKKINFGKEKEYEANEEDIKYFKETFEQVLFNEDFFDIFQISKIKEFLTEII